MLKIDRELYTSPFNENRCSQWICPKCGKGVLQIKKGTFKSEETSNSKKNRKHEDWEPDWDRYVYSCLLKCSNDKCGEVVANAGEGFVDYDYYYDNELGTQVQSLEDFFRPKYFQPHLKFFSYPKDVPEGVSKEIEQSFELFFSNPPSASNHIGMALENLLTHLKVKRYENRKEKKSEKKKRTFLDLHRRINLLPAKYDEQKGLFLAIKWLRNVGSHGGGKEITMDDVIDAYEIMETALRELFENKHKIIKKLAKKINKKKGPKGN